MTPLKSLYASGDKDAHVFELSLYRGTEEMDLSGASAQGYFIRADGYTVPITGAISGNVVTLTLSEGCYYVVGNFNLIIKVSTAESRKSVFWGNGYVVRSMTDAIVDGENVIPSLDELLAQISAAESAAKAANQAASAANSAATSAAQAASAAETNASAANSAANAATAAASTASAAATKIDDMTITAIGLAAGAAPTAELTEVGGHYNIALGLPKGDKGDTGATPQITVQVKTGEPGTAASVKQTGTAEAPVIELTIPRGDTGSLGALTINGKAPDAAGKVELTAADVGALSGTDATLTQAGKAADAKKVGTELSQLKDEKVNKSDALTLEEIEASTDLTGKVASASALKSLGTDFVHTKIVVGDTDNVGDMYLQIGLPNIVIAAILLRNYGSDTYSDMASAICIYLSGDNSSLIAKIVDDNMTPVASAKVAVKVYYVDAKYFAS
nr:MAG TPA: BppU domain protein [Caudoviricetes sp.]